MLADMARPDAKRDRAGRPAGPYSPTARRLARSLLFGSLIFLGAIGAALLVFVVAWGVQRTGG
jgi:hypothetical protein